MWHRLALESSVVCMTDGVVWYREHGEQEYNDAYKFRTQYEAIRRNYLGNPLNGLTEKELTTIQRKWKRTKYKELLDDLLKRLFNRLKG